MYIPKHYLATDKAEIVAFMQQYSFATLVTVTDNFPTATHLPFVIDIREDEIIVTSHFAKANKQWAAITDSPVLIIFSEPHAYISPTHYDKELNVPTWNYIAVHAYGKGKIITETAASFTILEKMINSYEKEYKKQWDSLPMDYKQKMLHGIVTFEVMVTDLQAKKKISQNKTAPEQQRIIASLSKSENSSEREIADFMKREYNL